MKRNLLALLVGEIYFFNVSFIFWPILVKFKSDPMQTGAELALSIIIGGIIAFNVLKAKSENLPISGDWNGLLELIPVITLTVLIPAILLGLFGGFMGERLYIFSRSKK